MGSWDCRGAGVVAAVSGVRDLLDRLVTQRKRRPDSEAVQRSLVHAGREWTGGDLLGVVLCPDAQPRVALTRVTIATNRFSSAGRHERNLPRSQSPGVAQSQHPLW